MGPIKRRWWWHFQRCRSVAPWATGVMAVSTTGRCHITRPLRAEILTYPDTGRLSDGDDCGMQLWIGPAAPEITNPRERTDAMLRQLCDVYGLTSDDLTAAMPHVDPTHTAWVWQLNAALRPLDPFVERFVRVYPWPQRGDPEPRAGVHTVAGTIPDS